MKTIQPLLPGLRVLAATAKTGGGLSVMVVNNSDEHRIIQVCVPGTGEKDLYEYRYFDGDRLTDDAGFPLPTGSITCTDFDKGKTVSMPGQGSYF